MPYARFRQAVRLAVEAYEADEKSRTRSAFVSGWHAIAAMGGRKTPGLADYLVRVGLIDKTTGTRTGKVRATPADRERAKRNAARVREAFRREPKA